MANIIEIRKNLENDFIREIQLAKASTSPLKKFILEMVGVPKGVSQSFLAISLLEYTKSLGVMYSKKFDKKVIKDHDLDIFTLGFEKISLSHFDYEKVSPLDFYLAAMDYLTNPNSKISVNICTLNTTFCDVFCTNAGVVFQNNKWHFCLEKYGKDLIQGFSVS